jgi:hypothetical protein
MIVVAIVDDDVDIRDWLYTQNKNMELQKWVFNYFVKVQWFHQCPKTVLTLMEIAWKNGKKKRKN